MKVVITAWYNTFSLSDLAITRLANEKAIGIRRSEDGSYKFDDRDQAARSDPVLVRVVEELGENAWAIIWGDRGEYQIVEIPDGTQYEVMNCDQWEWVAEKHCRWGYHGQCSGH